METPSIGIANTEPADAPAPTPDEIRRVMASISRLGASKGGFARAAKLSKRRMSQIGKLGVKARRAKAAANIKI